MSQAERRKLFQTIVERVKSHGFCEIPLASREEKRTFRANWYRFRFQELPHLPLPEQEFLISLKAIDTPSGVTIQLPSPTLLERVADTLKGGAA